MNTSVVRDLQNLKEGKAIVELSRFVKKSHGIANIVKQYELLRVHIDEILLKSKESAHTSETKPCSEQIVMVKLYDIIWNCLLLEDFASQDLYTMKIKIDT